MLNKRLEMADLTSGEVTDCSQSGYVDTEPVWLPGGANELLFCRGPEAQTVSDLNTLPGAMVPGQRIYKLGRDGQAAPPLPPGHLVQLTIIPARHHPVRK